MSENKKTRLLLHCCCAPCATYVIEYLRRRDYDITLFFYNPNIEPVEEYDRRKGELIKLLQKGKYKPEIILLENEYDNDVYKNAVQALHDHPEGGTRCEVCYGLRFDETAKRAKADGYDIFTTTLSVSPHKNAEMLNEMGQKASEKYDIEYMQADFKKNDGYLRSIELTSRFGLQRQNYCGCSNSMR